MTHAVMVLPAFSPPMPIRVRIDSRARSEMLANASDETEFAVLALMALDTGQCRYLVLGDGMFQPRWVEPGNVNAVVLV